MNQKLHRLAYPNRYKLSSGAELTSFRIPNILDPYACITTFFPGRLFDNMTYMGDNLLKQYEHGELSEEVVNKKFSPWVQIDRS